MNTLTLAAQRHIETLVDTLRVQDSPDHDGKMDKHDILCEVRWDFNWGELADICTSEAAMEIHTRQLLDIPAPLRKW